MPTQIARIMQEEGTKTTNQAVQRTILRWKETGGYKDRPKTVPEEHYRTTDAEMAKNDELTASDLLQILQFKTVLEAMLSNTLSVLLQELGKI